MSPSRLDTVTRFRRYQRWQSLGGGVLMTAAVLLTFALEAKSTAEKTLDHVRQSFVAEHAALMKEIQARESAFRIALVSAELMWREAAPVDAAQIQKYHSQGEELLLESDQNARSLWTLGSGGSRVPNEAIGKFFNLAEQIRRIPARSPASHDSSLASFFFGVNGSIVGLAPAPEEAIRRRILADRDRYLALLTGEASQRMLIATDAGMDTWRPLRWIPPAASPITGRQVIRIGGTILDKGVPVAVLVTEYVPLQPGALHAANRQAGDFSIMSASGQVIAAPPAPASGAAQDATRPRELAPPAGRRQERTYAGQFSISEGLGQTGWVLAFTLDWSTIVTAIASQLTTAATMTAATLALIWALFLYFELRVVRPLMDRSRLALESEHLNRTLIETAPVGLGLIDAASGSPLLHSPAMEKMTARVGAGKFNLSVELADRYRRRADGKIDTDVIEEDLSFVARDGNPVTLSVSMTGARYRGSNVVVAAFIDVTEKYLLAQRLREAKAAADRGNAAKSAFLAAMSHEIRTPLHAILGHLELFSRSRLTLAQRNRLETIRASSGLLLATISDVLDFSKIEAGELSLEQTEFDLTEIAARALSMFAPQAQAKGLALLGELGTELTQPMRGDPTRLGQVIHNLLSNAIKFTDQGKVVLRLRPDTATARITIEIEDSGIGMTEEQTQSIFRAFSQADATIGRRYGGTGLGLTLCCRLVDAMGGALTVRSEPGRGSLFAFTLSLSAHTDPTDRPWFSGEQVLLLATRDSCRHRLEAELRTWGLRVGAYSHPSELSEDILEEATALIIWGDKQAWRPHDEGRLLDQSSWVIDCSTLGPVTPQDTGRKLSVSMYGLQGLASALRHALQDMPLAAPASIPTPLLEHPERTLRVLVAEDNAANRGLFAEQFKLLGCEVDLAESGAQACTLLEAQRYDVLVSDLAMPGMDGYALARHAAAAWPDMPVIAATACVTERERQRCAEAGIARVLTKPLPLAELELALLDVCGQAAPSLRQPAADASGPQALTGGRAFPPALLRTFEQSCAQSLDTIKRAARDEDSDRLRGELHALRGMLAIFRLPALAAQCAQLDAHLNQLGVRGSAEAVSSICDDVLAAVRSAVETAEGQRTTEQA